MNPKDTVQALVADLRLGDTLPSQNPRVSIRPPPGAGDRAVPLTIVRVGEREHESEDPLELVLGTELGRGGMGVVRSAWQVPLGREVAVKLLRDDTHDGARRALLHEAMITGALEHPNIPPVHFLGCDERRRPLLLMKRIDGTPWRAMLDDPDDARWATVIGSRLDWSLGVLMQVANAVHFAHMHGYLHRDLKPDNVMIGDFGEVYVLDWGIAARIDDLRAAHAADEPFRLVGTPAYVAPEMIDRQIGPCDRRTDVYLLGGLLHHVLCGAPPHAGGDLVNALVTALTPRAYAYPDDVPRELAAIAERALALAPSERYESADQMRGALLEFLETRESARLVRQAVEKLDALRSSERGADRVETYGLFGECRFGFEEALRLRPSLGVAQQGLADAIATMVNRELEGGFVDGAELLLAQLEDEARSAELAERIRSERAKAAHLAAEHERLKGLEADIDTTTGSRARAYVALAVAFLMVFAGIAAMEIFDVVGPAAWMGGRIGLVVFLVVAGWTARKRLLRNRASRKLALSVLVLGVTAALHLWLAMVLKQPIEVILPTDMLFFGVGLALVAIGAEARTGWSALIATTAAFAGAYLPVRLPEVVGVALVAIVGLQVLIWGSAAAGRRRQNGESGQASPGSERK